ETAGRWRNGVRGSSSGDVGISGIASAVVGTHSIVINRVGSDGQVAVTDRVACQDRNFRPGSVVLRALDTETGFIVRIVRPAQINPIECDGSRRPSARYV